MKTEFIHNEHSGMWTVRREDGCFLTTRGNWVNNIIDAPNLFFKSLDHIYETLCQEFTLGGAL
jgi:hypothetical protein